MAGTGTMEGFLRQEVCHAEPMQGSKQTRAETPATMVSLIQFVIDAQPDLWLRELCVDLWLVFRACACCTLAPTSAHMADTTECANECRRGCHDNPFQGPCVGRLGRDFPKFEAGPSP